MSSSINVIRVHRAPFKVLEWAPLGLCSETEAAPSGPTNVPAHPRETTALGHFQLVFAYIRAFN